MSQIDFLTYGAFVLYQFLFCIFAFKLFSFYCSSWFFVTFQSSVFFLLIKKYYSFFFKNIVKVNDLPLDWQVQFQDSATSQMEGIVDLYADIMTFLAGIAVFVFYMLGVTVSSWYLSVDSTENKYLLHPQNWLYYNYHILLEIVWTITPTLILLVIAIPSFSLLFALEDDFGVVLWVKVIGAQWYWIYEYLKNNESDSVTSFMIPEEDLSLGQLRLLEVDNWLVFPVNTAVKFFVTSQDVLHSWAIPAFGVKIDACPGRLNVITVFLKRAGFFYGQCSEICGVNHAFMPIVIEVKEIN